METFYFLTSFGTHCLPALERFYREESQNQAKEHPEFPNKNLRQMGPGVAELWSYKQTNKHAEITTFIYIYTWLQNES